MRAPHVGIGGRFLLNRDSDIRRGPREQADTLPAVSMVWYFARLPLVPKGAKHGVKTWQTQDLGQEGAKQGGAKCH